MTVINTVVENFPKESSWEIRARAYREGQCASYRDENPYDSYLQNDLYNEFANGFYDAEADRERYCDPY